MKKRLRRLTAFLVVLALMASFVTCPNVEAATKLKVKSSKKITLNIGKASKIKTNVAANRLKFKSSNKKVATVNSKGKITAKKAGKANITVTSKKNKKQKATIKVTVKDTTSNNVDDSNLKNTNVNVLNTTEDNSKKVDQSTTEDTSKVDQPENNKKAVSITATYTGGIIPLSNSIDFVNFLQVVATYSDGTTKNLEYGEYSLSEYIMLDPGIKTITVSYQNLTTTFDVFCATPADEYVIYTSVSYKSTKYPLDTSKLIVTVDTFNNHYVINNYKYKYFGEKVYDGKRFHQYIVYYTEDFTDSENNTFHDFVWCELVIPIE